MKKRHIRLVLSIAALLLFAFVGLRQMPHFAVLTYHSIQHSEEENPYITTPEHLEAMLEECTRQGYRFMDVKQLDAAYYEDAALEPRSILLTLDDGYTDNYTQLFPILKARGVPALISLIGNRIGTEGYLTEEQIREMSDSGLITFASHTYDMHEMFEVQHRMVTKLVTREEREDDAVYIERIRRDLVKNKEQIERITGKPVTVLVYPGGMFNSSVLKAVPLSGFRLAFQGSNYTDNIVLLGSPLRLKRYQVNPDIDIPKFVNRLSKFHFILPFSLGGDRL